MHRRYKIADAAFEECPTGTKGMRLICPNCDAEYEVDASVIPENGRDVQCSSCGHAWYQMPAEAEVAVPQFDPPPAMAVDVPATADAAPEEAPPPVEPPARSRPLEESVLSVLREEAERESAARKAEAPPAPIETQDELALNTTVPPVTSPPVAEPPPAEPEVEADQPSERAPRRDLFPDIEEINSTLRPNGGEDDLDLSDTEASAQAGSGFRSGFMLMLVLAGVLVALYALAPRLAEQIPAAAPALDAFVAQVDGVRLWLDGQMASVIGSLDGRPAQ